MNTHRSCGGGAGSFEMAGAHEGSGLECMSIRSSNEHTTGSTLTLAVGDRAAALHASPWFQ